MKKWAVLSIVCLLSLNACIAPQPGNTASAPTVTPSITPAGVLTTYQDLKNHFELKYSEEDYYPDTYRYPGEAVALLLDVNKLFAGKNLEEVRVNVSVNPTCRSIDGYSSLTSDIEDVEINGVGFTRYFARDAGTNSNTFEHTTYQTPYAENCYELNVSVREYVLAVFPDLTEYSKDLLNAKLDPLVQSFRFLN